MVPGTLRERLLEHEPKARGQIHRLSAVCRGALPVTGRITLEVDIPDRHGLDKGLRLRALGSSHGQSQRQWGIGSEKRVRTLVVPLLERLGCEGSRSLDLLTDVSGNAEFDPGEVK